MPEAITRDNVKSVQSIYAAFARGDIKSILAATDPDIAWISNADPALLPFGGEDAREYRESGHFFASWPRISRWIPFSPVRFGRSRFCCGAWPFDQSFESDRRAIRGRLDASGQDP